MVVTEQMTHTELGYSWQSSFFNGSCMVAYNNSQQLRPQKCASNMLYAMNIAMSKTAAHE